MENNYECPKCKHILEQLEVDPEEYQEMSDGQQSNYNEGFERPFSCLNCGHYGLYDVEVYDNLPQDAYEMSNDLINGDTVEELIERGIKKRSFIEVISLFHNVIEEMLIMRIEDFILEKYGVEYKDLISDKSKIKEERPEIIQKLNILNSRGKQKYLNNFKEFALLLDLIDKDMFDKITIFNRSRNIAIHNLIRSDKNGGFRYRKIIETAKLGREIYLGLGVIKHSKEKIEEILKEFDIPEEEGFDDPFLNFRDED